MSRFTASLIARDLLCLPAVTWHETYAEGVSLEHNLSSEPIGFAGIVKLAIRRPLRAWSTIGSF
jgi:hypothetical protein